MTCIYLYALERVLVTPELNGMILPGITRQSILDLSREWGDYHVEERKITMKELIQLNNEKKVCIVILISKKVVSMF